ncbi:homeobox-leucine zipper protein HDG11-like isoform X1 [Senna tora]|uniref:Homeobox-leucine zipper protein HDG11-like isoform X1 n=1 Tax=Senna tora TaxID=362788 RepID=A0A834XE58_9FABA|nr:homeobox-leucine zipper protein HDG11-like isoform X1 [Senna tora]
MNFAMGDGGGGVDRDPSNSRKGKKSYHRHTPYQIAQLDASVKVHFFRFFKECPHPDENQRRHLGRELGLEPRQIKFWFQNKRTQAKTQNERADNNFLRAENERVHCENIALREALKNMTCPSCGGPPYGEEELQRHLQKLHLENAQLKQEASQIYERVSKLLARYLGKPIESLSPCLAPLDLSSPTSSPNRRLGCSGIHGIDFGSPLAVSDVDLFSTLLGEVSEVEKGLLLEAARNGLEELMKLLRLNDPLWVRSSPGGQCIINRDNYEKISSRANHFKTPSARVEASKDSRVVCMNAMQLVEMFLDSDKWFNIFPTILTKALTIAVLDFGSPQNRAGALLLMYEEMHILSPLVPPREFCFIRYCQEVEQGVWVIADMSFDFLRDNLPTAHIWKFPSGCMIHEMPNGFSKVTWVEHVEVDDKTQTHRLYRDLVCGNLAYGAQRWVVTLERMCERFAYTLEENIPREETRGANGRRSIMSLGHRMVKDFCGILNMSSKMDFPHLSEATNSGVKVSVRKAIGPGQPDGMIVCAATSLWLPIPHHAVFDFFRDEKNRVQWDILSHGNIEHEVAHISNGTHPGNCISIIRPYIPTEKNMLILQESCTDPSASFVVYAPIDAPLINMAIRGEGDTSRIPILPSGVVISKDGRPSPNPFLASSSSSSNNGGGSLLTVAFQILVCRTSSVMRELNVETVATVNTLISSTVQKIKVALDCASGE